MRREEREEREDSIGWPAVGFGMAGTCAAAALLLALAGSKGGASWFYYVSDVLFAVVWTFTGLLAWRTRPGSAIGRLMLALGLLLMVNAPFGWRLPSEMPGRVVVTVFGAIGFWFSVPLAAHLLLTYPTGRPAAGERRLLWGLYGFAGVVALGHLVLLTPDYSECGDHCTVSPIGIVENRELFVAWRVSALAVFAAGGLVIVAMLIRKYRAAGHRWATQRRVILAVSSLTAGATCGALALDALTFARGSVRWSYYGPMYAFMVLIPLAFFVGLLRDRIAYASVADLVRGLDDVRPGQLEASLARTLEDPDLQLLFPIGADEYVGLDGHKVPLPVDDARAVTRLGEPLVAVLVHDPTLSDHPRLMQAASSAARLALDNARLQAEVLAQLAEVRASRARIVAAANDERRRLERDLHDGAQQRLLGIGMSLRLLHDQDPSALDEGLQEVESEVRAAIRDLRDFAQGIHPAVLTDEGLAAAIGMLARRLPVPVTVQVELGERLPPEVEATAYYIVSEGLQNVVKHAGPCSAVVSVRRTGGELVVQVSDDGRGGASMVRGTGLRGLHDRALAVEGTLSLTCPAQGGSLLEARLPCA